MIGWIIAGAATAITTLVGFLWAALKRGARADARATQNAAYRKTRERIDNAGNNLDHASGADIDRRLREHADQ